MKSQASCGCEVDSILNTFPTTVVEQEIDFTADKLVDVYVSGSSCFDCTMMLYFSNSLADICSTRKKINSIKHKARRYK